MLLAILLAYFLPHEACTLYIENIQPSQVWGDHSFCENEKLNTQEYLKVIQPASIRLSLDWLWSSLGLVVHLSS